MNSEHQMQIRYTVYSRCMIVSTNPTKLIRKWCLSEHSFWVWKWLWS